MSDVLTDSQRLFTESLDAMREQRLQVEQDLKFSDPSDPQQWDESVKIQREGDPGGKRPCLVMDQTGQYVANVAGQIEKQPPAIHAIPVGGGADKKAAEQLDGRFRHIEHASRAAQHYARALTSAARTGVGYLTVRPAYVDRALGWQEPRISSEPDPMKVIFDPWSVETDGSDATFGFILTSMSLATFDKQFKGKEAIDFGDTEGNRKDNNRKSVLIAEQFYQDTKTRNMIVYFDQNGQEQSGEEDEYHEACQAAGMQLQFVRNYKDKYECVKWRRMSGSDVLEESDYMADSIGIVPVYGYIGFADGRLKYCGIPRRARVAQQAYNYHVSEQLAYIGTQPKAPWLASKRATAGVEKLWDRASAESRAWLPYNDLDDLGAISMPSRINSSSSLVNHEAGAAQALRDIQASIGMYQANLGAQSNETSGVAIESRKQQGEASTAHFPAHMAASLGHLGNIVMQMDARLTDTQREQPIIGVDGSVGKVDMNPSQETSFERVPGGGVSVNPNVGKYSIRVVVGASYSTQRSQTNAAFGEIMRGNPEMAQTIAPFWAQTLDFPGSDKFAQALAAMAPEPVKAILQPEGQEDQQDPAKMAAQMQQMQQVLEQTKQALQEAIQHAHDAQEDADKAISAVADAKREAEVKERELDIKAYDAETKRLSVTGANVDQIQAVTRDLIEQMLNHPDPLPGEQAWQSGMPMGEGPGPDETPMHEQAESPQMEQQELATEPEEEKAPPGPSPEMAALLDGHTRLTDAVGQLTNAISRPRTKIPVRDKHGNITHVIEKLDDEQPAQE